MANRMYGVQLLLLLVSFEVSSSQEGAQYLHNVIRDLKYNNPGTINRRTDALPAVQRKVDTHNVPALSLTKGELTAIYEAAVAKGDTVKLGSDSGSHIHAAVHHLDDPSHHHDGPPDTDDDNAGYYYYYYPIKSFMDNLHSHEHESPPDEHYESSHHDHDYVPKMTPTPQYHSHTHQHNVHITPIKSTMDEKKPKGLEPLFMAISGFIGMAVMFVLSVLVLPKFGVLKSRGANKPNNAQLDNMARIALRAIEGYDCTERLACELGNTARAFNLYENRFIKLLRRMTPSFFGKQMDKVGKYSNRKHRCAAINCKRKVVPLKKPKPVRKKPQNKN